MEKLKSRLKKLKTVGLDTSCFIYQFEQNPKYLPFTSTLFEMIEKGRISAITSVVSYLEVLVGPKRAGLDELASQYRYVFHSFPNLIVAGVDLHIADLASDLRASYSLDTPDAINLSCALAMEAKAFISNDKKLKRVKEIEVLIVQEMV